MRVLELIAIEVAIALGLAMPAAADDSRQTLSWQPYEQKDVLTDKITHIIAADVKFPDGVEFQVFAGCQREGFDVIFVAFHDGKMTPLAWHKGQISLPVVVDSERRRDVQLHDEDARTNKAAVLFYNPTVAKGVFDREVRVKLGLIFQGDSNMERLNVMENKIRWEKFISATGGTTDDLERANSIRLQFPLVDGSANVIDIDPQNALFKSFVTSCVESLTPAPKKPTQQSSH